MWGNLIITSSYGSLFEDVVLYGLIMNLPNYILLGFIHVAKDGVAPKENLKHFGLWSCAVIGGYILIGLPMI